MKTKSSPFTNLLQGILLLILCTFLFSIVTSCTSLESKESLAIPTLEPTPTYLLNLVPTGVIRQNDYEESRSSSFWIFRGIAVGIFTKRMSVIESNREWEVIKNRVKLFIDGEQIPNDTLVGGPDGEKEGGLFRLSWAPVLTPGAHDAKFQFTTDEGEILEYSWQFVIEE